MKFYLFSLFKRGVLGLTFFFMINAVSGQVLVTGKVTGESGASIASRCYRSGKEYNNGHNHRLEWPLFT